MNKPLTQDELLSSTTLMDQFMGKVETMDRPAKLRRLAKLCRETECYLNLGHNLEYLNPYTLTQTPATYFGVSAISIAAADPEFQKTGMPQNASLADVMRYIEISQQQLHEFSCDCGGHITNEEQARRIERLI
jgi:DNA-binding Xre family transcriptional regulator